MAHTELNTVYSNLRGISGTPLREQLAPWPGHRQRLRLPGIRKASTNTSASVQARKRLGYPQAWLIDWVTNVDDFLLCDPSCAGHDPTGADPLRQSLQCDGGRSLHHILDHEISFEKNDMRSIPEKRGRVDGGPHASRRLGAANLFNSSLLDDGETSGFARGVSEEKCAGPRGGTAPKFASSHEKEIVQQYAVVAPHGSVRPLSPSAVNLRTLSSPSLSG